MLPLQNADFHVHTTFCDGASRAEETVLSAIARGFCAIGFSSHAPMPFPTSWAMRAEETASYRAEIAALKEKYRDQIAIFCGVEQDYFCETPTDIYDYAIGAVHCIPKGGDDLPVDDSPQTTRHNLDTYYHGDFSAYAEDYFALVTDFVKRGGMDLVGHFDLITKFCERGIGYDPTDARYRAAWKRAADAILEAGIPFEINTGAISRGYRVTPYPSEEILRYFAERGGKAVLTSDSHRADTIGAYFDRAAMLAEKTGITLVRSFGRVSF